MNPLPPNADELVSAYLDGQAAPDEVAIVEANPELMERVEALRRVSDLLRAPMEPPAEQKEAHIAAALGAFDAMFSADETPEESSPPLAAVPPVAAEAAQREQQPAAVTSLDTARERRRPRRFNTGVIAAAAAAMLLFVAIAAFGFGGGDSADVATTAASDTADFATDAGDDAMEEEAMADDEDAMDDSAGSALSALPAPTVAAPETARAEAAEAMEEEAMDDDEDAMDDSAADEAPMADQESAANVEEFEPVEADNADADGADAEVAGGAGVLDAGPLLFADFPFPDLDSLLRELEALPADELQGRALLLEPGLFPSCQANIADLAAVETPTLVGQAFVADEPVEIHQTLGDNGEILFVLVDADCMILQAPNS